MTTITHKTATIYVGATREEVNDAVRPAVREAILAALPAFLARYEIALTEAGKSRLADVLCAGVHVEQFTTIVKALWNDDGEMETVFEGQRACSISNVDFARAEGPIDQATSRCADDVNAIIQAERI